MKSFLLTALLFLGACAPARFPVSDHSDGREFFNDPPVSKNFWALMKWRFTRQPQPWPDSIPVQVSIPDTLVDSGFLATWVGHATVLVQTPGLRLLTDPVWSDRVGPWSWAGSRRFAKPGVRFEDLPRIDVVLVSHDHYDHLDEPTLRRLAREHDPVGVAGLGTADLLKDAGFSKVVALDWWESTVLPTGDTVTLVPAYHWSMRWPWDRQERLWGGFVVGTRSGRLYYTGDTGDGPHFAAIGERFGPFPLALIAVGAYEPRWFMSAQHIGPDEALEAARTVGARTSIGVHWGTFALADDGPTEAADSVRALLARQAVSLEATLTRRTDSLRASPTRDSLPQDFRVVPIGTTFRVR